MTTYISVSPLGRVVDSFRSTEKVFVYDFVSVVDSKFQLIAVCVVVVSLVDADPLSLTANG